MPSSVESCEKNQICKMSSLTVDNSAKERKSSEGNESMISVKIYDSLITELRCPSCARPMVAPIKLCETGHSSCTLCTKMLAKCPLCSKPFTENRSLTLEAISAKAQFRCSNSSQGCPVRLQLNLLEKHEERCVYQLGDCFMGKVWGNCKWHGREIDWLDHCELEHREKVFFGAEVSRTWECKRDRAPNTICGFFLFRVFGETFNLYQIFDKPKNKMCWTMVCAAKEPNAAKRYSFEIELYSPSDDSKIIVQRYQCHSDRDASILQDGQCATFGLGEIMRFMNDNRILHYRIKVIENSQSKRSSLNRLSIISANDAKTRFFENDFTLTKIEGSNSKEVPAEKIITRRSNGSSSANSSKGSESGTPPSNSSPKLILRAIQNGTNENTKNNNASITADNISMKSQSVSPKNNSSNCSPSDSTKRSPIATLKKLLNTSPIKFGSRKGVSLNNTTSPDKEMYSMTSWEKVAKSDSIDNDIIERKDLQKIFVRSYNIDVKKIDDLLNRVNSVPKPPRMSLDNDEMKALLGENRSTTVPSLPSSPIPDSLVQSEYVVVNGK